ncbi:MAG: hypothetical protein IRY89_05440 [Pseudolabrys sp.]|nr:hypothetical protein [Pseudolabrys sp.]
MRPKAAAALVAAGVFVLLTATAEAAPQKKRVTVSNRQHTVFVSRDENGRTRTRIIIQKRSFLDPGTESFPGERSVHEYAMLPTHHATSVLDNTTFGDNMTALPRLFTLPTRNNPWLSE